MAKIKRLSDDSTHTYAFSYDVKDDDILEGDFAKENFKTYIAKVLIDNGAMYLDSPVESTITFKSTSSTNILQNLEIALFDIKMKIITDGIVNSRETDFYYYLCRVGKVNNKNAEISAPNEELSTNFKNVVGDILLARKARKTKH